MSTIVDELKGKFGGTGQTIAEVVKTMESGGGSGGGVLLITVVIDPESPSMGTLDKTWKEIHDAYLAGKQCIVVWDNSDDDNVNIKWSIVSKVLIAEGSYEVMFNYNYEMAFTTRSEDGYPEMNLD